MPLAETLGTKAPGQLIKSEDWNALVAGVNAIEAALDLRLDTVEASVAALDGRVGAVEASVVSLRTDVDAILASTFRVMLETTKVNFAIGELAEITATVRDARGNIPAPVNGERPWVDFVTTWGKLKAVAGFTSRAGVAERTVSVQTNAQGIARARLSAEIVDDLTDDNELDFSAVLDTRVGAQSRTISEIVLGANTPSDQEMFVAYQAITASYDSPQRSAVKSYADSYYVKNGAKLSDKVTQGIATQRRQQWRDHHITVLAFGKADSDPRTPDPSRGSNAMQLTFRDWLGPWIIIDYIPGFVQFVPQLTNILQSTLTQNYTQSALLMKDAVQQRVQNRGIIGKAREYESVKGAIQVLNATQPTSFLPQLKQSMTAAVDLQQSFQTAEVANVGGTTQEVAFQAFAGTAVRADSEVAGVTAAVQQVEQSVQQVQSSFGQQVTSIQQSVGALGGRLDATLASGGQLEQIRSNLTLVTDQVQALRSLGDPTQVTQRLNLITSLDNRLQRIERGG